MVTRIATALLGLALVTVGLAGVYGEPFLGWLDVSIGILALLASAGMTSSARYASTLSPLLLAGATMVLSVLALVRGASSALVQWPSVIALGLLLVALPQTKRNRLL